MMFSQTSPLTLHLPAFSVVVLQEISGTIATPCRGPSSRQASVKDWSDRSSVTLEQQGSCIVDNRQTPNHGQLSLAEYDENFLAMSWEWLRDPEIKALTRTPDFTKVQQRAFFDSLPLRHDYRIHGVLHQGIPVGAAGLKKISSQSAEYWGYLGDRTLWGKGLGVQLIELIVTEARNLGLSSLYLNVGKDNPRAIALYRKTGFVATADTEECLVMTKQLEEV